MFKKFNARLFSASILSFLPLTSHSQQGEGIKCSEAQAELKKSKDPQGFRKLFLEDFCPNPKSKTASQNSEKYLSLLQTKAEHLMDLEQANVWISEKSKIDAPLQQLAVFFESQNNHPKRMEYYKFLFTRMNCTDSSYVESAASQVAYYLDRDPSGLLQSANAFDKELKANSPKAECLKEAISEFPNPAARSIYHAINMVYGGTVFPPEQQKKWDAITKDVKIFAKESSAQALKTLMEKYGTKR